MTTLHYSLPLIIHYYSSSFTNTPHHTLILLITHYHSSSFTTTPHHSLLLLIIHCSSSSFTSALHHSLLLLCSSLQKCVSECAFDGYHWSNPKCYVNTDAQSRQRHKAESGSNCHGPQIHRLRKLKLRIFLKSEFWPISRKFVPTKITNHTVEHNNTLDLDLKFK